MTGNLSTLFPYAFTALNPFVRSKGRGLVRVINDKQQLAASSTFDAEVCVVAGKIQGDLLFQKQRVATIMPDGGIADLAGNQFNILKEDFSYSQQQLPLAAQHFYTNWIHEFSNQPAYANFRSSGIPLLTPDFTPVDAVVLPAADKIVYGTTAAGKEDGGLLYVPGKGKVCFFATKSGSAMGVLGNDCDAGGGLLDNNCFIGSSDEIKWAENIKCK